MKLPWIQLFTGDWLKDPALTLCGPLARGVWIDWICAMHESGRTGELTGTIEQLAILGRASVADTENALLLLQNAHVCDVVTHPCNALVTVTNRRMKREHSQRDTTKRRVQRYRGNAPVTPECNGDVTFPSYSISTSEIKDLKLKSAKSEDEEELLAECLGLLGKDTMTAYGATWRTRARNEPDKLARVIAEIRSMQREGKAVRNAGAYANDLWNRFSD